MGTCQSGEPTWIVLKVHENTSITGPEGLWCILGSSQEAVCDLCHLKTDSWLILWRICSVRQDF